MEKEGLFKQISLIEYSNRVEFDENKRKAFGSLDIFNKSPIHRENEEFTNTEVDQIKKYLLEDSILVYLPHEYIGIELSDDKYSLRILYIWIDKSNKTVVYNIQKTKDEWYYVASYRTFPSIYFECDQFDGLMACLKQLLPETKNENNQMKHLIEFKKYKN